MQNSKVVCSKCSHYKNCSKLTRMYINYCGPRKKALKSHIAKAHAECKNHRGNVFKLNILMPPLKIADAKKYKLPTEKR